MERKCKLCRREGSRLFLKGQRCDSAKCPVEKRSKPPGLHGWRGRRVSPYGVRLREKQKCKRYYGVQEAQFRRFYAMAEKERGNTGENLLSLLERRLDNVVTVSGFAVSRAQARQMVRHRKIQVNGQTVDISSYLVEEGDVVRPFPKDSILEVFRRNREQQGHPGTAWLDINDADLTVRVARLPVREDVTLPVDDRLIVEFCSR